MFKHLEGGLEAGADDQQHRVRAAVSVFGAESRGPPQQGGGRGAHHQQEIVRAERAEGDERRVCWQYLFRPLSQVILVCVKNYL